MNIRSGFEKDPKKSKFEVFGRTKKLTIVGKYTIDGKGKRPFELNRFEFLIVISSNITFQWNSQCFSCQLREMDFQILLSVSSTRHYTLDCLFVAGFVATMWSNVCVSSPTENVDIHAKVVPKVEVRQGEEYIHIEKVKIEFKTTK